VSDKRIVVTIREEQNEPDCLTLWMLEETGHFFFLKSSDKKS